MITLATDSSALVKAGNYVIPWENTQTGGLIQTVITVDTDLSYDYFLQDVKDFMRKTFTEEHTLGKFDKIKTDELEKTIIYQPRLKIIPISEEKMINTFLSLGYNVVEYKENWCILERYQNSNDTIIK